MTYRLVRRLGIRGDRSAVYDFFESPRNLEAITPEWLNFHVTFTSDERMRQGTRIGYRLRLAGLPLTWESRIAEHEAPSHFADEQVRGPYRRWYHRHLFQPVEGGVEMTDIVDYEMPFGFLGRLVHWLVVRHQLRAIFDHRARVIGERFGTIPLQDIPAKYRSGGVS